MNKKRLNPDVRKSEIIAAALAVASRSHYAHMTRDRIALEAGVAGPTVQHYLGTMPKLRRSVMRAAVKAKNLTVIAQGLIEKDPHALKADDQLQVDAMKYTFKQALL